MVGLNGRVGTLDVLVRCLIALGVLLLADYYNPFSPTGDRLRPDLVLLYTTLIACLTLSRLHARLMGRTAVSPSERVEDWAKGAGCPLCRIERRWICWGPFLWTTGANQKVFRIASRDAEGREQTGWARVGSFFGSDASRVEVRWDEAGPAQPDLCRRQA